MKDGAAEVTHVEPITHPGTCSDRDVFRLLFDDLEFFDFSDDRCTKSSFGKKTGFIFSNFPKKCLGTGASEKLFGPSRDVREGILEGPGASWDGFGRSWGDLGATFGAVRFRIDFLIDFERDKGAQREAF